MKVNEGIQSHLLKDKLCLNLLLYSEKTVLKKVIAKDINIEIYLI